MKFYKKERKKVLTLLIICFLMMGTLPASAMAQDNSIQEIPDNAYAPGEILVKFKPEASKVDIEKTNSRYGASVVYTSPYAGFKKLKIPKSKTVEEMVEIYSKNPNVEYAVPNYVMQAAMTATDPYYKYQWNFNTTNGINVEPAWDISTGNGVVVAVLDTGVAYEKYRQYKQASDLADTSFAPGYDFVNNDAHPNDDEGHGTHVAGTIAQSTNNGIGVAGVAFDSTIMPVKVLDASGSGYLDDLIDGIYFAATNNADVISMSLSFPPGYDPGQGLKDALDDAYINGTVIVAAAGNDGTGTVCYPAAYEKCIAVGATTFNGTLAYYSNYGADLDIVAPGGDMRVDQNLDAYGDGILQQTFDPITGDFGYYFYQGTSMATPHVSGVAALVISNAKANGKDLTPAEVRTAIESTARDLGTADRDDVYGWGLVDAYAALTYAVSDPVPNEAPVANAGGPYSGTEDVVITFDGSASYDADEDPLIYTWNFGDGSTGTGVNPTHTYTAGGPYTVTLIVNDGKVDSNPSTATVTIAEVNDLPVADAGTDQSASVDEIVSFDGSGSSDDGNIVSYDWDFGDGATGSGVTINHAYATAGTYTVTLTVTDDGGLTDTDTATVEVTVADNQPPVADAGPSQNVKAGNLVTFDGSGSYDPDGTIVSYYWDFGDGSTGTGVNPTHTYISDRYTVTLTVTDNDGLTSQDTVRVMVRK